MAHYTVNLPGNMHADVKQGKVFKKMMRLDKHWPWIKFKGEERTGYVITIDDSSAGSQQYCMLKTIEGTWTSMEGAQAGASVKIQGKWQPVADDQVTLAIKKAIDAYENK